eukprot:CAMPEP_0197020942 /NCGR_PEP_ID=MMETSP1384-20130603/1811_1 /TAXON_ID=29189 /ORGANISM="Ammonia sp." /LENGTH=497 /DNA_ID=CAMNT_0042448675 /DNA_START=24 /DNA_END=1514 /DNA_ORIENTATION=+
MSAQIQVKEDSVSSDDTFSDDINEPTETNPPPTANSIPADEDKPAGTKMKVADDTDSSDDTFSDGTINEAVQTNYPPAPDTTASDAIDGKNTESTAPNIPDEESDEFDFSEQPKRLKLKPSNIQKRTEQQLSSHIKQNDTGPELEDEREDEDKLAMQTEVLSDFLKPTSILSKYQHGPQQPAPEEPAEEEEKEWPTDKEELAFNTVTEAVQQNANFSKHEEEEEEEEEKSTFEPIEFEDLYLYLRGQANTKIKDSEIVVEDLRNVGWLTFMKLFIFGGCSISLNTDELMEERDDVFKIAKLKLNTKDIIHHRCLISLWMKLTNDLRACDKTGSHWQQIGFQGNDPATDIRGAGLLGVLQLVYLIENRPEMMSKIYLLSLNEHQNFPLVIVSFTITGIVMQLLRSCTIFGFVNSKNSVMLAINEIYVALFYEFYLNWKNQSRTIVNFDEAQKELEKEAFANWQGLIDQVKRREAEVEEELNRRKENEEDVEFGNAEPA